MSDPVIDLGEVARKAGEDQFWALRGHAIQAYANLEQSLCRLMAHLGGMSAEVAALIFFRVTNTQARNAILKKLFRYKFREEFNLFRNSLVAQLRLVDMERNEIVHWNVATNISVENNVAKISVTLHPPNFLYTFGSSLPTKNAADLVMFIQKCDFYTRLINMFSVTMDDRLNHPDFKKTTWLDIFVKPIIYPPPADHPLAQTTQTPEDPPQPSQG